MRENSFGDYRVISLDHETTDDLLISNYLVPSFVRRPTIQQLVNSWQIVTGKNTNLIVFSHANIQNDIWTMEEDTGGVSVQEVINRYDGQHNAIMLFICNDSAQINSQQSLVLHFDGNVNLADARKGRKRLRVYVPHEGYVEHDTRKMRRITDRVQ